MKAKILIMLTLVLAIFLAGCSIDSSHWVYGMEIGAHHDNRHHGHGRHGRERHGHGHHGCDHH